MRGAVSVAVVLAALAVGARSAEAATDGKLKQLPLPDGCLQDVPVAGCGDLGNPLSSVGEPAMSSDGRYLYVPGRGSNSINAFRRDPATGVLTQIGCVSFQAAGTCVVRSGVTPLQDATAAAVHGDSLYVVGGAAGDGGTQAADGIAHFTLGLDGVPTFDTCVNADGSGDCTQAPLWFGNPAAVAVSPDGENVYVANHNSHSISVFERLATGTLSQANLTSSQRCVSRVVFGCTFGPLLLLPRDIEVTPDGKQVVVANAGFTVPIPPPPPSPQNFGVNVSVLDRDQAGAGALVPHAGFGGCVTHLPVLECPQELPGMWGPTQIAFADNQHIYSISFAPPSPYRVLLHILRNPDTGNLTADRNWCLRSTASAAVCADANRTDALNDAFDIALGPGGAVYASGYAGQRVGVFERLPDNTIRPKPGALSCVAAAGPPGCGQLVNPTQIEYVQPSPDGKHVYALGIDKIFTFAVDTAPRCTGQTVDTPHNTTVTITLQCSDVDGDPLSFQKVSDPARGRLLGPQGGTILYEPLLGTSGTDTFQFTALGADIAADPATVTVNVAAPPLAIVDADGDGSPATADCNDNNPRTRPGAREIAGNGVDENCDGRRGLARFGSVASEWDSFIDHTVATRLRMANTPRGAKGQIRCRGKDCEFRRKNVRRRGRVIDFLRALKPDERSFAPGQTVEVRVTAPNYVGKVVRYPIKSRAVPDGRTLCLPPGGNRPRNRCQPFL